VARVALDAMGGDHGSSVLLEGAAAASAAGIAPVLVGDEAVLSPMAEKLGFSPEIVHAPAVISMDENPARAVREKRDASVVMACRLVANGKADGMVSAGSTGATMTAAVLEIGRSEGITRPAIAAIIPSAGGASVLLDAGANPECKPEHLLQFAYMGVVLAKTRLHIPNPKVGLFNNGTEEGKGRYLEREVFGLLKASSLDFIGNVEGHDVLHGTADVVVTDGFVGNAVLKASEATAARVIDMIRLGLSDAIGDHPEMAQHVVPPLMDISEQMSPDTLGGASLLGVDGVVTIAHGTANAAAIEAALLMTADVADSGLVAGVKASLGA